MLPSGNVVCEIVFHRQFIFIGVKYFLCIFVVLDQQKQPTILLFHRQTWRRQTSLQPISANVFMFTSVIYLGIILQYLCLNILHGVIFLSSFLLSLSLSNILAFALADQHTNAASLDKALSHMAVFFFHGRPRRLPLWCHFFSFIREHISLHLQNCPDGWQGACVCSHAICSLSAWTPPTHTHTNAHLNSAGACYWPCGDWVIQEIQLATLGWIHLDLCINLNL